LEQVVKSLRQRLRQTGFCIVAKDEDAAPAVITLALQTEVDSVKVGEQLEGEGFLLSYRSSYLKKRNWLQICLMGDYPEHMLNRLIERLKLACC
jgi:aspartate aminotransferase-like enzyme